MKRSAKILSLIGALALALLLAACSSNSAENLNSSQESSQNTSRYSSKDIMFAEMMIPHHEQAIVISDLALSNSTNPEILKLAKEIKAAQAPEIELMKSWEGVNASTHMGHTMMGMLTEAEIDNLKAATGSKFDRLFLEGMIKHHEGAIDMAGMIADSENLEVAKLGKTIISTQTAEIKAMQELLGRIS